MRQEDRTVTHPRIRRLDAAINAVQRTIQDFLIPTEREGIEVAQDGHADLAERADEHFTHAEIVPNRVTDPPATLP